MIGQTIFMLRAPWFMLARVDGDSFLSYGSAGLKIRRADDQQGLPHKPELGFVFRVEYHSRSAVIRGHGIMSKPFQC